MSRIGRQPIPIPPGVEVTLRDAEVVVKGPKGELRRTIPAEMSVTLEQGQIVVRRPDDEKRSKSLHGLTRTLIANMVQGVTAGYRKTL
jgi:large subunit ribosomal protein L6